MQLADLKSLSTQEKLQAMEALWDALCQDTNNTVPSPAWHAEELKSRDLAWSQGQQTTSPWSEAKQRILAGAGG
jgi:putative addiction module component (TIGR02574 family)